MIATRMYRIEQPQYASYAFTSTISARFKLKLIASAKAIKLNIAKLVCFKFDEIRGCN